MIGCGIGCGALVVLGVSSCLGVVFWVTRPGELIEPERLLAPDTTGYVEWTLRLEDPGTEGFVERAIQLMNEFQRQNNEQLPAVLRGLQNRQGRRNAAQMRGLFPLTMVWTMQPGQQSGTDLHLLSLSLKQLGNRMVVADWFMGFVFGRDPQSRVLEHAGEQIYQLRLPPANRVTFFLAGNDVFFCSDFDTAAQVVDRLGRPDPTGSSDDLARLLAQVPEDRALRGAIVNAGQLERLLGRRVDLNDSRGLILGGGLQSDGSFQARIEVLGPTRDWAEHRVGPLTTFLRQQLPEETAAEIGGTADGERVVIDVTLPDLVGSIETLIDSGFRVARQRT